LGVEKICRLYCIMSCYIRVNNTREHGFRHTHNAQCADSEVRNAIERTPYIVVLKFHVFILISKSFNFRSPLDRILRYLTKTRFYTLNFKKNSCWSLSIAYWVIENDSVSDTKEHIFVGPLELKILSSLKQMTLTKYNWMPLLFGTH